MDQRCGLQRLARHFVRHFARGEFAEFFIDQRQQFPGRVGVAAFDGVEDLRDVAHARSRRGLRGIHNLNLGEGFDYHLGRPW